MAEILRSEAPQAVHYFNLSQIQCPASVMVCEVYTNGSISTPVSNHDFLRRSSSSSSSGSSADSGFEDSEKVGVPEVKDVNRREQVFHCFDIKMVTNKVAAFAYRQRMKSVSEQAEVEYKDLLNHNKFLLEEKTRLETQISKIRQALDKLIQISKAEEEEERRMQMKRSESQISIFKVGPDSGSAKPPLRISHFTQPNDEKVRKKEQNRIASKRFRERRRMELSRCKEEANHYETANEWLRMKIAELEDNIVFLRQIMEERNIKIALIGNELK